MNDYKIIVTGPVGSGKTTSILSVCDTILETDESVSDRTSVRKRKTTVAMDYGTLKLGENETIHLYGLTYEVCGVYADPDGRRTNLQTTNPTLGNTGGFYRLPITRTITVGSNVDVEVI